MHQNSTSDRTVLDYILALLEFRKRIIGTFFAFLIMTYGITLFLPKWYKAEVVILPPQQSMPFGISAMMDKLPIMPSLSLGQDQETQKYLAILHSKTLYQAIIKKFDLQKIYETEYLYETIQQLQENTEVIIDNENTIRISVVDQSPDRAAEMANAFAYFLDSLFTKFSTERARFHREFLEEQLNQTRNNLKNAELALQQFQKEHGTIALPEQIEASIKTIGDMLAEKYKLQIELDYKKQVFGKAQPEINELQKQISAIESTLKALETNDANGETVLLPFKELPDLALQYARLLREVEIQNKIFAVIYQEYLQAKIEESKDTPTVQVLDPASPPEKRYRPKRVLTAAVTAISTTVILVIALLIYIHLQFLRETDPIRYEKLNRFFSLLFPFRRKAAQ